MDEKIYNLLDKHLYLLSEKIHQVLFNKENDTPGYGMDYENEIFMMHRYCWCDEDDCPWCGGHSSIEQAFGNIIGIEGNYRMEMGDFPNFLFKPNGFSVNWYKYIGRDMDYKPERNKNEINTMFRECFESLDRDKEKVKNDIWKCCTRCFNYLSPSMEKCICSNAIKEGKVTV